MTKHDPSLTRKFLLGAATVLFFCPIIAMAKPTPMSINQKIHNFEAILSQAKKGKIDEAELSRILQQVEDAEVKLKAGDLSAAEKLYSEAWEAYQGAVKTAQTQDHKASDERRLAARTASIKALLTQFEEIGKGSKGGQNAQFENVKSLVAQAEAAKDTVKALALVNHAYFMTKITPVWLIEWVVT